GPRPPRPPPPQPQPPPRAPGPPAAGGGIWGVWHATTDLSINLPIGDYQEGRATNLAFNRWGFDLTGSVTYLNLDNGREASLAVGFTTHLENDDTNYSSGNEFHLEWGLSQSLPFGLSIGLAGYHYHQIEDDSGPGAPNGGFEGRVTALGPALTYTFQAGQTPITLKARYYREFNTKNRLRGDVGFVGVVVPLGL
ncbi:MAG: transporter, partial [Candidatus Competibacterales bacterium]